MDENAKTLAAYEERLEEYMLGSPTEALPALTDFLDEAFSQLPTGSTILELGSGFGRDAAYMRSKGFRVIATDGAKAFVDELKSRGFDAHVLNVLTDPFPRADGIFANAVFLHLTLDDLKFVLEKLRPAMAPAGVLAFTVKEGRGEEWSNEKLGLPRYFRYWSLEELEQMLEETGFELIFHTREPVGTVTWLQLAVRP